MIKFADPTIKNNEGNTSLYNIPNGGDKSRVRAVIASFMEKGVDLESRNRLGRTALLAACQNASSMVLILLQCGASVKSKDFQKQVL